jgi:hypothetical protein
MQHFYNTHIFKSTMGSLREEEVETDVEVNYFDNEPILELLSSQVKLFISKIHVYSTVFLLLTVSYSDKRGVHFLFFFILLLIHTV